MLLAALGLLALAPTSQAKVVVDGFGIAGGSEFNFGGYFGGPTLGIAVNNSGNGAPAGTAYVVDGGFGFSGTRVQRFSPGGAWQRAWGQDVISTTVNERQRIAVKASAGTYTLTFNGHTTDPIPYNLDALNGSVFRDFLAALPPINGIANIGASGSGSFDGIVVTYQGALGGIDQPLLTVDTSQLTGTVVISPITDGASSGETGGSSTGFEICTVAGHCKAGSTSGATSNGGQLNGPQGVAVNQFNGHVYVTEGGNRRVAEFDADGGFVRAFGWDVVETGGSGDVSTDAFEICTVAAECRQGVSGENGGQFGFQIGYPVIDGAGNVWVPDASNRRIQEFDSAGNFIAAYGYNVDALGGAGAMESCTSTTAGACQAGTEGNAAGQFSFNSPRQIAFDNLGNVYAIDSGNNRVQKFDPTLLVSVSDFGTGTFPTYTTQAPENLIATQGGARLVFSVNSISAGGERQLLEIDPSDASVKDTSLVGSKLTNVNGLGVNTASGDLYVTTTSAVAPRNVLRLSSTPPAQAPVPAMNEVTTISENTATFKGTVDPKGGLVSCAFQYSTNQETWTDVAEPDCASLLNGGGIQAVGEGVVGFVPNTHYFARLSVSRPLVPGSTQTSPVKQFDTEAPPPIVSSVGAFDVQDVSARIGVTIDPRNSATGYVLEYGTTPALGSSTAPLAVGDGVEPIVLSQLITGLTPDTDYYFRVVATNASGSTASPQDTFHTRADALPLPENRAYEMVTPPNKNLGDIDHSSAGFLYPAVGFSPDGNSTAICTQALFGDPPPQLGGTLCTGYLSRRGSSAWHTKGLFPPACRLDPETFDFGFQIQFISADFNRAVTAKFEPEACAIPPLDPAAPPALPVPGALTPGLANSSHYLQDLDGDVSDPSSYQLLTTEAAYSFGFVDGSDDFSHVFLLSDGNLTAPPDSPAAGLFGKLYEWVEQGPDCGAADPSFNPTLGGCLSLVSRDENDVPFMTESNLPSVRGATSISQFAHTAVSADGSRIYFQNTSGKHGEYENMAHEPGNYCHTLACQLYMREDGTGTFKVSESECTVECDPIDSAPAKFEWGTEDGSVALFKSSAKLTDDPSYSGEKFYRWDRDAPPGNRLTLVSLDQESGDGLSGGAGPPIGMDADGDTIYFFGGAQLVPGGSTADGSKVYRWQWNGGDPRLEYLGTVTANSGGDEELNGSYEDNRVTPDGRYLLLNIFARLDPVVDKDNDKDAYRWDEENGWLCLSCQAPGVPSAGHTNLGLSGQLSESPSFLSGLRNNVLEPTISADGKRVLFDTPDALVPEDTNGELGCDVGFPNNAPYFEVRTCSDVYEWNDGRISLISSGVSPDSSYAIGLDRSSENAFFFTREQLVGWDVDNNVDIYTARIGGGFPEPPPQPPECEGEACRGAGTAPADVSGAGTAVFQGPPSAKPAPRVGCPKGKRRVQRRGKVRCVPKKAKRRAHKRTANRNRRAAR